MIDSEIKSWALSALTDYFEDDENKIENTQFTGLEIEGVSFCSEVLKVSFLLRNNRGSQEMSVILKTMPIITPYNSQVKSHYYPLEYRMYKTYLPVLQSLLESVNYDSLFPKCYALTHESFLLEDLSKPQWRMARLGMDLTLSEAIVFAKGIGIFHAVSKVAEVRGLIDVSQLPRLTEDVYGENYAELVGASHKTLMFVIDNLWDNDWKAIGRQLDENFPLLMNKMNNILCTEGPGTVHFVNLGDPWKYNGIWKYDKNGIPQSVKFFDFQGSCYSTYVRDLIVLLTLNLDVNVSLECKKSIIKAYLESLEKTFKDFDEVQCDPKLSIQDVFDELERAKAYQLLLVLYVLPLTKHGEINDNYSSTIPKEAMSLPGIKAYLNNSYTTRLQTYLKTFDDFLV